MYAVEIIAVLGASAWVTEILEFGIDGQPPEW